MPAINMFFGIIIRMYLAPKELSLPHIHAFHQDHAAGFNIESGVEMGGHLPVRHQRLVIAWIEIHKEELMADWNLCQNGENPLVIAPLH